MRRICGDRRSSEFKSNQGTVNLPQVEKERNQTVSEQMAEKLGISEKTYRDADKSFCNLTRGFFVLGRFWDIEPFDFSEIWGAER